MHFQIATYAYLKLMHKYDIICKSNFLISNLLSNVHSLLFSFPYIASNFPRTKHRLYGIEPCLWCHLSKMQSQGKIPIVKFPDIKKVTNLKSFKSTIIFNFSIIPKWVPEWSLQVLLGTSVFLLWTPIISKEWHLFMHFIFLRERVLMVIITVLCFMPL